MTVSDKNRMRTNGFESSGAMHATVNSMSLQGIKVDQLCEILSREIGRVREESVL